MDSKSQVFFHKIEDALNNEKLLLPTLPEVALNIREKIEHQDCSAADIAALLAQDGAMSAHFIRVANSPLYRGLEEIQDLQTIITRMGLKVVKDLVMGLALKQIFMATSDTLDTQFRKAWSTSVGVGAISRMLAVNTKGLTPEQALLAGLIHNIGTLPILVMAEQESELIGNETEIKNMIYSLQHKVGNLILTAWQFPDHLVDVVRECHNFNRQPTQDAPSYTDLVQVALIQGGFLNGQTPENWESIQAFRKLNLDPEINIVEMDENQVIIEETKQSLLH